MLTHGKNISPGNSWGSKRTESTDKNENLMLHLCAKVRNCEKNFVVAKFFQTFAKNSSPRAIFSNQQMFNLFRKQFPKNQKYCRRRRKRRVSNRNLIAGNIEEGRGQCESKSFEKKLPKIIRITLWGISWRDLELEEGVCWEWEWICWDGE